MKDLISVGLLFFALSSCSSNAVIDAGNSRYISQYSDSGFGATGVSATEKAMVEARNKCGNKTVNVVDSKSSPRSLGSFPEATITFTCD